jgi:hypothetical protein
VIRLLLALVVVALGAVLALRMLERSPVVDSQGSGEHEPVNPVQEADQVRALLETQQRDLEATIDRSRQ